MKFITVTLSVLLISFSSFATIGPISGPSVLCIGNYVTLTDTSAGGTWSSSNPSVATVGSVTGIVYSVAAGTVTVTYTKGGSFATYNITVNPTSIIYSITGTTFCAGTTSHIGLSGSQFGSNYQIYLNGVPLGSPFVGTGYPLDFGAYSLYIGDEFGVSQYPGGVCNIISAAVTELPSCSGTPEVGITSASSTTICPDTALTLNLPVLQCGISYQWQASADDTTWTNISGATSIPYAFTTVATQYYRAKVTCSSSGLSAYSAPVKVTINASIQLHSVINNPDTICNGPVFQISTCSYTPGLNVTTYFGDGALQNTVLTSSHATVAHVYAQAGTYKVKQVLYHYTTPVDSVAFSYEYFHCRTLPVKLSYDANDDSIYDAGDYPMVLPTLMEIDSNGISIDTVSITSGYYYKALGNAGTVYAFKALPQEGMAITYPSGGVIYDTIASYVNNYSAKNFGLYCGPDSGFDLSGNVSNQCGRHLYYGGIYVHNASCNSVSSTLTMNLSPKYNFIGATPSPTSISGHTITWDVGSLSSSQTPPPYIYYWCQVPGAWLIPGDTVQSTYIISPITGDIDTSNNTIIQIDTVKSSFDPNEMSVTPQGNILPCTQLRYTINFENTGNASAGNIYVMDTLPGNVDPHSLRIIFASAPMNISMPGSSPYNIARFDFPNINLPDSSYHNQCDGVIVFTINTKAGVPDGSVLSNQAGIFFDDNPVVMTNAVTNIIGLSPIAGASHVCNTQSILLTNATSGGAWSSSSSTASVVAGVVTGLAAGTDVITYSVSNVCSSEFVTKVVTIDSAITPAVSLSASPTVGDTVCDGTTITCTTLPVNGGASPAYLWKVNGSVTDSGITFSYLPSNGDMITVKMISNANCAIPDTALGSLDMTVLPYLNPSVSIMSPNGNNIPVGIADTFVATVSGTGALPLQYKWYINGNIVPGATSSSFVYDMFFENDVVSCNVTAIGLCGSSSLSNKITLTLSNIDPAYVSQVSVNNTLRLFPNPANTDLTVTSTNKIASLVVSNLVGQKVYYMPLDKLTMTPGNVKINVAGLPSGVYFVKVNGTEVTRFVKE